MSVVVTIGSFDLPHVGHMFLFEQCRKIAGKDGEVVVGINTDEFITKFKGRPPIQSFDERRKIVLACRWVTATVICAQQDAKPLLLDLEQAYRRRHGSDEMEDMFLVIGQDWALKDYYAQLEVTQDWLTHNRYSLIYVPRIGSWSSTELKERIRNAPNAPALGNDVRART